MGNDEITRAIEQLARLPGLGPRSAQRIVLHLLRHRESRLAPLAEALAVLTDAVRVCGVCGNFDTADPCRICASDRRQKELLCVVKDVAGGLLSPLDGVTPEDLRIPQLVNRVRTEGVQEVILALDATVEGQTTAHYIADALAGTDVKISHLAHGMPMGGELEFLDDGTIAAAFRARR